MVQGWTTTGRRFPMRRNAVVLSILAVVLGLSLVGLAAYGFSGTTSRNYSNASSSSVTDQSSSLLAQDAPSSVPSAAAKPSAKKSPAKKASSPRPSPSKKKVTVVKPPPKPKPQPVPSGKACPYHEGTDASKAEVSGALSAAANHPFYSAVAPLDLKLMKAIAWQESGWQSTIMACDGGIGTMQLMPDTVSWMNDKFGTTYDAHTLTGNTMVASAYLQWLVKYFGDVYFDSTYDLSPCETSTSPCLLNAVIASYNYGFGAVDTDSGIVIPNPQYVGNVRALMESCPCFSY
jgi:soluble lytic murein transglycosylase-like protein